VTLPVPNKPAFDPGAPSAIATMRKAVNESLSGTSTVALPFASSTTDGFHTSKVSNSSREGLTPPPPPGGAALRPKWRLPTICICAVAVSTA
jgi:hypothetical protein